MRKSAFLSLLSALTFAFIPAAKSSNAVGPREETSVSLPAANETWRIDWLTLPKQTCLPQSDESVTCPCAGFSGAQYGSADLIRVHDHKETDRLHIDSLFQNEELPVQENVALLSASAKIMTIADYNHDGWASEFVLPIGTGPCGHRRSVLIGITPNHPKLHAFGTIHSPDKPLVLSPEAWKLLLMRNSREVKYVSWACGDHAADEQTEIVLSLEKGGIRALQETFTCTKDWKKGARVRRDEL